MKSGHDTDYQDDIHLLLQRLCTASDSVPKEQRFELGQCWSKVVIRQLFALTLLTEWQFSFMHRSEVSLPWFLPGIHILTKSTCSLLTGKADHTLRTSQVAWVKSQQNLYDRASKTTLLPWKPIKYLNSRAALAAALPSHSLWYTWLTTATRGRTPPDRVKHRVLKINSVWLPQCVYQAEAPNTSIMFCHAPSYCPGWATAAHKVQSHRPSGPAAGAAQLQRPSPTRAASCTNSSGTVRTASMSRCPTI